MQTCHCCGRKIHSDGESYCWFCEVDLIDKQREGEKIISGNSKAAEHVRKLKEKISENSHIKKIKDSIKTISLKKKEKNQRH